AGGEEILAVRRKARARNVRRNSIRVAAVPKKPAKAGCRLNSPPYIFPRFSDTLPFRRRILTPPADPKIYRGASQPGVFTSPGAKTGFMYRRPPNARAPLEEDPESSQRPTPPSAGRARGL